MTKLVVHFDRAPETTAGLAEGFAAQFATTRGALTVAAAERYRSPINAAAFGNGSVAGTGTAEVATTAHVFVLVESGAVIVESEGELFCFQRGQSFVAGAGSRFTWRQEGDVDFAFSCCADTRRPGKIVPIVQQGGRTVSAPYAAELLLSPENPQQAGRSAFTDSTTRWQVGVWNSQSFERKSIPFPKDEYMYIHTGAAEFHGPDGERDVMPAGSSFLLGFGTTCTWKNEGLVDKTYCAVLNK